MGTIVQAQQLVHWTTKRSMLSLFSGSVPSGGQVSLTGEESCKPLLPKLNPPCKCAHTQASMHTRKMLSHPHTYKQKHDHKHKYMCPCTCMTMSGLHLTLCMRTHAHTHTHAHTCMHTHACHAAKQGPILGSLAGHQREFLCLAAVAATGWIVQHLHAYSCSI